MHALRAQFRKISARTPSQPLLFLPVPVVSAEPLVMAGIGSLSCILSRSLVQEAKNWETGGRERAAAPSPRDP